MDRTLSGLSVPYRFRTIETGHIYTEKFALAVVNLKQIDNATEDDIASGLRDWARLFQASTWEEMRMIAKNNESMKSFAFSLKELSEDEKIQMQCEARERYEHDKASFIQQGFDNGVKEGIRQEQNNTKKIQEQLETEKQRAETEKQRVEIERRRADAAEAELRRLQAELAGK